jgi:hypothetical protein
MLQRAQTDARRATGVALRVLLTALVAGFVLAAPVGAVIVFECSDNLCRINPDGSGRAQITGDGSPVNDYHWPSLSRDGTRMSWIRHGGLFLGDPSGRVTSGPMTNLASYQTIRPDGGQIAALEWGAFPGLWVYVHNADGSIAVSGVKPDDPSFGWTPAGRLLLPWKNPDTPTVGICIVSASTTSCEERVAFDPASSLADPAVSPDGRLLAVSVKARSSDAGGFVALYDMATHARVHVLTNGTQDTNIAWSPDGGRLVFQRGMSLYTTPATGAPGSERLLSAGETPSWGGPDAVAPTPAPAPSPAAFRVSAAFRLPSNSRCVRRGARLTLRYLRPPGITITRLQVLINRRTIVHRAGSHARRSITLPKIPARRFTVTVRVTRRDGLTAGTRRSYRPCR